MFAELHVTQEKKYYNPMTQFLLSKNVKNRYFAAIFVNIIFPVLSWFPPNIYLFPQFQWSNIQ